MTLAEAWIRIKLMDGAKDFAPRKVFSILADLGVFQINPRIRLVLKAALNHDLWHLMFNSNMSDSDILSLKSKLEYDGFSKAIINDIIFSFYKDSFTNKIEDLNPKEDSTIIEDSTYLENKNLVNNVSNQNLNFVGIELGSQLNEFTNVMKPMFKLIRHFDNSTMPSYVQYTGQFAGIKECGISLFFDMNSKQVYKVVVTSKQIRNLKNEYERCKDLYSLKYGKPAVIVDSVGKLPNQVKIEKNIFQLNANESIEIRYNPYSLKVVYCNTLLLKKASENIMKNKGIEQNIKLNHNLSLI